MMDDREFNEFALKIQARLFLNGSRAVANRLTYPTQAEWVGINLMIRDDEIKNKD